MYIKKGGMWALKAMIEPDTSELDDYLDDVLSRVDFGHDDIARLDGLEVAYFDIFMARMSDDDGGGTCEFEMKPHQIDKLSQLGVPVQFTIAVTSP